MIKIRWFYGGLCLCWFHYLKGFVFVLHGGSSVISFIESVLF